LQKAWCLISEDETIAVIASTEKDAFYNNIRLAIAEHYCCDVLEVSILMDDESYQKEVFSQTFEVEFLDEDGDASVRTFEISETAIYF
jgi:hypothetical protein